MAGEDGACLRGLDTREAAELLGLDRDLLPEADLVGGTTEEADAVRVQRLVDRRSARLGAGDGDARRSRRGLVTESSLVAVAQVLDNCSLHRELDEIHWYEPADILGVMMVRR